MWAGRGVIGLRGFGGNLPKRSPASGVPPRSRSWEEKFPLPHGLGLFWTSKTFAHTPPTTVLSCLEWVAQMRFRRIRTVDLGRFSCCPWWSDFCPVSGVHPLRSPASGLPPWSRSKEEKLPLSKGLGRFLNIKKPSRTPPYLEVLETCFAMF